jgi:hypothetical protein
MDGSITDEQAHLWLQEVANSGWVSLHYDSPALGGDDKGEIAGGGYGRFKMVWSQPNNRAIWSLTDARWTGLTQNKLTYFGVWNQQFNGMLRAYAELPSPVAILNGKGYILYAGSIVVSFG